MKNKLYKIVLMTTVAGMLAGCGAKETPAQGVAQVESEVSTDSVTETTLEEETEPVEAEPEIDVEALKTEAVGYYENKNIDKDYDKALELFKEIEDSGKADGDVFYYIAKIYDSRAFDDDADKKKVLYYQKAIDAGNAAAITGLAECYLYNGYVDKDEKKALEMYLQAIDAGDIDAYVPLASLYENGIGVDQDNEKVIELLNKGIEAGSINSMKKLADYYIYRDYDFTRDIEAEIEDYNKAIEYYNMAVDNGDLGAIFDLASTYDHYALMVGDDSYEQKAIDLYSGVLDMDVNDYWKNGACSAIGWIYFYDDYSLAEEWFLKASDYNSIANRYHYGNGTLSPDKDKALEWYQKAVDNGDENCNIFMGEIYEEKKDYEKAYDAYLKASEGGYQQSEKMTELYLKHDVGDKEQVLKFLNEEKEFWEKLIAENSDDSEYEKEEIAQIEDNISKVEAK